MGDTYKVIGTRPVAGVQPGEQVTEEHLIEAGAQIAPLVGVHIELVKAEKTKKDTDTK